MLGGRFQKVAGVQCLGMTVRSTSGPGRKRLKGGEVPEVLMAFLPLLCIIFPLSGVARIWRLDLKVGGVEVGRGGAGCEESRPGLLLIIKKP